MDIEITTHSNNPSTSTQNLTAKSNNESPILILTQLTYVTRSLNIPTLEKYPKEELLNVPSLPKLPSAKTARVCSYIFLLIIPHQTCRF